MAFFSNYYMDVLDCIKSRRSIRKFENQLIPQEIIEEILECGRWAPSGVNFQPWKVFVVSDPNVKEKLAKCTKYSSLILNAPHTFAIFLDQTKQYHYTKHIQSIGAFFQTLLLALHAKGLGGVWLGEIYNQKDQVSDVFGINDPQLEFMGAIAFGKPAEQGKSSRKKVSEFVVWS
ncbi:Bifunctional F420 biosynthesis protein FbiB [Candidatus Lokiarchaeum ossiferum]